MGIFDTLKQALDQFAGANSSDLIEKALGSAGLGDLQSVVDQLRASGLESHVQSWLGGGEAMPISAESLASIVSNEQVQQLAQHFGVDPSHALGILAHHLPMAVAGSGPSGEASTAG